MLDEHGAFLEPLSVACFIVLDFSVKYQSHEMYRENVVIVIILWPVGNQ